MSNTIIGQRATRIDAEAKVTGKALYPGDLSRPDVLYMKILFARRPHARVVSIDTRQAEAHPGVVAVFTARDVPVNEYGLQMNDQPVLCGPGSGKSGADVVRFEGDQVAAVVANSEKAAATAAELVDVTYEDLPLITDPLEAMKPGAHQLIPDKPGNLICHYRIRKGDAEAALAAADVVVEGEYTTSYQEHAYLQPEAGLAYIDDAGRVTVEVAGQWVHTDQEQIAHALGLEPDRIRVIYPAIGGAFGGREDMSVQIVLALAVWHLDQRGIRQPVKIVWSREESIIGHGKRHPMMIRYKSGATKDGKLVAAQIEIIADGGAYCYTTNKVLGNATVTCSGPYAIANVHVDTYGVYTNNVPGAAFRGFGAPQVLFAAEMQINKLAAALELDPVELRWRNALREGDTLDVGTPPPGGVVTAQVIEAAATHSGWVREPAGWHRPVTKGSPDAAQGPVRKGIGFAAGFKNVGFSFGYPEHCCTARPRSRRPWSITLEPRLGRGFTRLWRRWRLSRWVCLCAAYDWCCRTRLAHKTPVVPRRLVRPLWLAMPFVVPPSRRCCSGKMRNVRPSASTHIWHLRPRPLTRIQATVCPTLPMVTPLRR
jgi:CO/xanthine dehydrogenase Mo-binding subunit